MPQSLLDTKLRIPTPGPGLVERPRLLARLDEGLEPGKRLILVSGPAGYGKTSLLSQWASARERDLCLAWLSLDEDDNDPLRFLAYVVETLKSVLPETCCQACAAILGYLESGAAVPPHDLIITLLNGLGQAVSAHAAQPVILVLDDYQFIEAPPVHTLVADIVERLPARVRVLVATRIDPPLGLARLRARSQMLEIRVADLQFSEQEAARFLNGPMKLALSDADLAALAARTEGWITGLHLAALSLQQRADHSAFIRDFSGSHRFILEYLLDEVLDRQPPAVQSFLQHTAVPGRLCAALCDDLLEGIEGIEEAPSSQDMLETLERNNLFLTALDDEHHWYRYHRLFADLLRRRMRQSLGAETTQRLHRRAIAWYEAQGCVAEAIQQALAATDPDSAAGLMERHILTFFYHGETRQAQRWLSALPESLVRERPLLCAVFAAVIALMPPYPPASLEAAEPWMQVAEQALAQGAHTQATLAQRLARAFILTIRSYWTRFQNAPPQAVISLARQALDSLGVDDAADRAGDRVDINFQRIRSALLTNMGYAYWTAGDAPQMMQSMAEARRIGLACGDFFNSAAATSILARLDVLRGRLVEAERLCRDSLRQLAQPKTGFERPAPFGSAIGVQLGEILVEWNRLDEAESILKDNIELARWTAGSSILTEGLLILSRLELARSCRDAALEDVEQVAALSPVAAQLAAPQRVRCWLYTRHQEAGEMAQARQWARGQSLVEFQGPQSGAGFAASLALARVALADQAGGSRSGPAADGPSQNLSLADVLAWLERQKQALCAGGWMHWLIELLVIECQARLNAGNETGALASLRQAVELAEPGGYVRVFAAEGEPVRELLARLGAERDSLSLYVSRILSAFPTPEREPASRPEPSAGLVEPLSAREIEVLRMVCQGRSNQEIAATLVVSLNTIKKHTHHIFGKLGVSNRAQAILRAQQLGLLAVH